MTRFFLYLLVESFCLLVGSSFVRAEAFPVEIQAKNQIICNQRENFCTAQGDAVATRNNLTVRAEVLRVFFEPLPANSRETKRTPIRLEAEGHVVMTLNQRKAVGKRAVYDLVKGIFTLSGSPRLDTPQASVRSEHPLVYFEKEERAEICEGLFIETAKKYILKAHKTHVFFKTTDSAVPQKSVESNAAKEIERAESEGDVLLSTPKETLRSDRASYHALKEEVILKNTVKATQGSNILEGEYAVVSLKNGDLKLYASDPHLPVSRGRVKALLLPKELQNKGLSDKKQPTL